MAKKNRNTLKNYFSKGSLPSESHFSDLIDSMLNMLDEGFDKSPENGLEISPLGRHENLISFYRKIDQDNPLWSIKYDQDKDKLLFVQCRDDKVVLVLAPDGKVGVKKKNPEYDLDVEGVVAAEGRIGSYRQGRVPADGRWHRIVENLDGCQAFEIMAGAGRKKTGKYALMHALALNTFNPKGIWFNFLNRKKSIRYTQAYYRSGADKLKLRWVGETRKYHLEIKSNGDYGEGKEIQYSITRLWFDEYMGEYDPETGK